MGVMKYSFYVVGIRVRLPDEGIREETKIERGPQLRNYLISEEMCGT
jgi:hypothetical protein